MKRIARQQQQQKQKSSIFGKCLLTVYPQSQFKFTMMLLRNTIRRAVADSADEFVSLNFGCPIVLQSLS